MKLYRQMALSWNSFFFALWIVVLPVIGLDRGHGWPIGYSLFMVLTLYLSQPIPARLFALSHLRAQHAYMERAPAHQCHPDAPAHSSQRALSLSVVGAHCAGTHVGSMHGKTSRALTDHCKLPHCRQRW